MRPLQFVKRKPMGRSIEILGIACLMFIGSLNLIPFALADDSTAEKVPEPYIVETHDYNKPETYQGTVRENFDNEKWQVAINQGDVKTLLMARNYSNTASNQYIVDYSQNINFYMGGKFYISMFTVDGVELTIGDQTISTPLRNCNHFEVTHSPVRYDGTIPTLDCNITYEDIRVYPDLPGDSSFDLTLIHHIRGDWNQTSIKIEALLNFSHLEFYNGTNPPIGQPFTAEIKYNMQLTDPGLTGDNTIQPSSITNSTLAYNLTLDNGTPYSLSKLDIKDDFQIFNASGSHSAIGYSYMKLNEGNMNGGMSYNPKAAMVTHGFPNMTYKDTLSMKSDPEITIYHDRVSGDGTLILIAAIGAIAAAVVIGAFLFMKKRNKVQLKKNPKG